MDFDPLDLFTPSAPSQAPAVKPWLQPISHIDKNDSVSFLDVDSDVGLELDLCPPIHIHDLPLLQYRPPANVLILVMLLLAPDASLNFAPSELRSTEPSAVFAEKGVDHLVAGCLDWLQLHCPRFSTPARLASLAELGEAFRRGSAPEYNAYLTRLIALDLAWVSLAEDVGEIKRLASLRLAENCGRTAQPELERKIKIPGLDKDIVLHEPSLTADNLGLKTWGSAFMLGSRLASCSDSSEYLADPVLELGAGTGLVGMVALMRGCNTTLTDLPEIVPNLQRNVSANGFDVKTVAALDWTAPDDFIAQRVSCGLPAAGDFSTIIFSDPLYSPQHVPLIVAMADKFLGRARSARVLIQLPRRQGYEAERTCLWETFQEAGFEMETESVEQGYDDFGETTFVFRKYVRAATSSCQ